MVVFLDTYAIMELDKGNPNYKRFAISPAEAITTKFNLVEVHFYYLKNFGQKEADRLYDITRGLVIDIDDSIIKEANNLKLLHLKKRLSFADCIGYATAKKFKAKFITGDYVFKDMDNVEFLK